MRSPNELLRDLRQHALIAIIRGPSAALARRAALSIHAGGIHWIEVTLSVPGAVQVIAELAEALGDRVTLGAGTVLEPDLARQCVAAGARFVVSPVIDPAVVKVASDMGALAIPGALTPTEVVNASRAGAACVKVFPCSAVGGAGYIKALRAPLPDIKLVATGGVHLENVADYLAVGATAVAIGAGLVNWQRLEREGEESVVGQTRRFVAAVASALAVSRTERSSGPA
ncbi:bifunctional 4-hydroxy-2-oxoglutarate aldolase/2-dehydro-3-deoxy-phosphogluconate aldolase [Myxococcota bacterium]